MFIKTCKMSGFLALSGLICALILFIPSGGYASDSVAPAANGLPAGFYQFDNLEIFKSPVVDEPPASIDVIQKNDKSCLVYKNGKTDQPTACVFNGSQDNYYTVMIDKETTLLGVNQESALLSDFLAGDKINVLGLLAADSKTIKTSVARDLEEKDYHQSLSGTIKEISGDGFTITLANGGGDIFVKTPIAAGAQVTVKGVFDKVNKAVNNVLSILIKPNIVLQEKPAETTTPPPTPAPSAAPSTLFRNFLKIFGL